MTRPYSRDDAIDWVCGTLGVKPECVSFDNATKSVVVYVDASVSEAQIEEATNALKPWPMDIGFRIARLYSGPRREHPEDYPADCTCSDDKMMGSCPVHGGGRYWPVSSGPENKEPTMTKAQKRTLPIGTRVEVRRDNGDVLKTTTRSEPWKLGGHTWVVMVVGIAGGYDLDRVTPVNIDGIPL